MRDFRKLEIWKRGHQTVLLLYKVTQEFPMEEKYGLTNQIRRAGVSIPSNIAEGCEHESDKEFARYLQMAAASSSELLYQLILAYDLKYLNDELYTELSGSVEELKKMIFVFTKRIRAGSK